MRSSIHGASCIGVIAVFLAVLFAFGTAAAAQGDEDSATFTGISKDRSCTWWLDESKEVSKEDKADIKTLFEALEKKLETDGIDSVKYPWKPPEEEEKAEEGAKDEVELTDEQRNWADKEWYEDPERSPNVVIPSKDDLNIAKIDGVPTGTLFVVRGTFDDPRIEVWRMKLAKEDDEWSIKSREIDYSFEHVYFIHTRKEVAYRFDKINLDHDQMHIEMADGRLYPLYAGNDKIIGGAVYGKSVMNYKPPTKLAKDWETDQEPYQLKRHTKNLLGKDQSVGELKDVALDWVVFYCTPSNFDNFVKMSGLEEFTPTDEKELEEAKEKAIAEVDWLMSTSGWGAKLP
ncbi:MAG: hypothetical protein JW941_01215, partial [Candidatus Coatesbacteria bacterium]|nr:hypothetical protein [Candidatus Coatesbacteria bacterium]